MAHTFNALLAKGDCDRCHGTGRKIGDNLCNCVRAYEVRLPPESGSDDFAPLLHARTDQEVREMKK